MHWLGDEARAASNAGGHLQGSQRCIPRLCTETRMGSNSAGVLLRFSSLMWNDHTSLLLPCSPSRRVRFAAMRIDEMGSACIQSDHPQDEPV